MQLDDLLVYGMIVGALVSLYGVWRPNLALILLGVVMFGGSFWLNVALSV